MGVALWGRRTIAVHKGDALDTTQARMAQRLDRRVVAAILVAAAVSVVVWWVAPWHDARPIVVQGTADANAGASSIWFRPDSGWEAIRHGLSRDGEGFALEGAWWAGPDNVWHDTAPVECLRQGRNRVELGFVRMRYGPDSPGGPARRVTSIRCLG